VRILLVEDNAEFRRQEARFLASDPRCEVISLASSGAEAVEKAERLLPDLVLMDLSMPGMNGFEATRRIKALRHSPRVVIVTLYGGAAYSLVSESSLADGFLSKTDFAREFPVLLDTLFPSSTQSNAV
jgi:DNA-binding NarL/FixJ family response regulator